MVNLKMKSLGEQGSAIRELFEYGKARKKIIGEENVYDFSLGNPSVCAPDVVKDELIRLLSEEDSLKLHGYTSSDGSIEVREKIADYLNNTYDTDESAKYIYLTSGAAAGLTIALNACLNEGDEVIVFAPFFPEYRVFIEKAGGNVVVVKPDNAFLPDFVDFESKISSKTKAVIINSPNNPTGVIYSEDVINKIADILVSKQKEYNHDIYLISDEPYRELVYGNYQYPFVTKYYNNSLVVYSFSKSLSIPGERIGYILVGSKCNLKDDVYCSIKGAGRALGFVCATSLFQYLIPKCLGVTSDLDIYKENRDILYNHLVSLGYDVVYPKGAFYLFVKALEDDAVIFSKRALEEELLLVPSDSFGVSGYVRISYCVSKDMILRSLDAFSSLMKKYK